LIFAFVGPGLAISRLVPTLDGIDRVAVAAAASLATNVTASLVFAAFDSWGGTQVLVALAGLTLAVAALPRRSPWKAAEDERKRVRSDQMRARRLAQASAYDRVMSDDLTERREGMRALSWLLEDDERWDEAARLQSYADMAIPPRLELATTMSRNDRLGLAHRRAQANDPETRRRGLLDLAELVESDEQ